MNLQMNAALCAPYRSNCQRARVVTEDWAERSLFCVCCDNDHLSRASHNTPAIDFSCRECSAGYQLKSTKRWSENRITDAGYAAMIRQIRSDRVPNLFVLGYDPTWAVRDLLIVPSFLFSESAIEPRRPLAPTARRAGWIGCNILLSAIAPSGKLRVVTEGVANTASAVRAQYAKLRPIWKLSPQVRGWTLDVLRVVQSLDAAGFTLHDVYLAESEFAALHPANRNVRAKIRQQLQVLRDLGLLRFASRGHYVLR